MEVSHSTLITHTCIKFYIYQNKSNTYCSLFFFPNRALLYINENIFKKEKKICTFDLYTSYTVQEFIVEISLF